MASWTHKIHVDQDAGETGPDVLKTSSDLALERGDDAAWGQDATSDAIALRALTWRCLFLLGQLQGVGANADGTPQPGDPDADPGVYSDPDHAALGRGLVDPLAYLGAMRWQGWATPVDGWTTFETTDGDLAVDKSTDPGGAGALPVLLVVGVLVGATVLTAAICYLGQRIPDIIDRELARSSATKSKADAMMGAHAAVVRIVEAHLEAEKAAGHALPLDDAEKAALQAETAAIADLATAIGKPPPEVPLPQQQPFPNPIPTGGQITTALMTTAIALGLGWLFLQFLERKGAGA